MVYFSFNDYLDNTQNGEIKKIKKVGEENAKYELIYKNKKTLPEVFPITEIIQNKTKLKDFLKDFFQIDKIIENTKIIYCNDMKAKIDKKNNNIVICKIKNKEIFIIIKEINEIDTNIAYKMFEYSSNIIDNWKEEKGSQKTRNPIVIPIVIYTGEKLWNNLKSKTYDKIRYIKYKNNKIIFSYNMLNVNELDINILKNMKSDVAKQIIEMKNKYLQIN